MTHDSSSRLSSNPAVIITVVFALCVYALYGAAQEWNNWRGFWFTAAHMAIVAVGAWLALRKTR